MTIIRQDPIKELNQLTQKLNHKLKVAIFEEQKNEKKREQILNNANDKDKKQLEYQFNTEREKAKTRINEMTRYFLG